MIYVIRHGETEKNRAYALQGRSDLPLNEKGREQAADAGKRIRALGIEFSHVFSSPLVRAVETAKLIAPDTGIITDDRLIEMDYGPYEGADMNHLPPEVLFFFKDFVNNPAPHGMEQLSDVVKRTGSFIEDIKELKGDILISTHAIAMKGILEYLTPGSNGSYWPKYIGNCAVYTVDVKDGLLGIPVETEI
ncbi:MAG: histidine phosphatase family protein [Christensenellaceae bacterium]|nr:histidine phosphatase family protein [Christensenellaceae bacterium]